MPTVEDQLPCLSDLKIADVRARLNKAIEIQRARGHTVVSDLLETMDQLLVREERRRIGLDPDAEASSG